MIINKLSSFTTIPCLFYPILSYPTHCYPSLLLHCITLLNLNNSTKKRSKTLLYICIYRLFTIKQKHLTLTSCK